MDLDELETRVSPKTKARRDQLAAQPDRRRADEAAISNASPRWRNSNDFIVIADEIYSRNLYLEGDYLSIAALAGMRDRTIIVDGFSKAYAMTGWRFGYAIMPEALGARR